MEFYILDALLRRETVVDKFESAIWTERFSAYGDLELVLHPTLENRELFQAGTLVACNNSHRVMRVETPLVKTDDEGKKTLSVTGKSLEALTEDRIAQATLAATTPWSFSMRPDAAVLKIFRDICVTGVLSAYDKIPFINTGNPLFPVDTNPHSADNITVSLDIGTSVYQAMVDLCDAYGLGFRIVRFYDQTQLYFDVYAGSNRTTGQGAVPAVVFAPNLDNLQNTSELVSIEGSKNVAYVVSPVGAAMVYPDGGDTAIDGFDRRVLYVDASDITSTTGLSAALQQRGKEELAKYREIMAFDGEISQSSQYRYFRDYNLGDLVEVRDDNGLVNEMQVTEQIFAQDEAGERSYPTLALRKFITPGSWLGWDQNQHWFDLDTDPTTWSEQS